MFDISIEIIRALLTAFIVYYLYSRIKKMGLQGDIGWRLILAGFCVTFFATVLDITDNVPGLEKYIFIGDTVPQAILEKVTGYLFSSVLILAGFVRIFPMYGKLRDTRKELHQQEVLYRDLVQSVNSVILRWDRNGRIIFLNDFGQRLFGYTLEEIKGRHVLGTIVAETATSGRDLKLMISDILHNPERYALNENENICKDGSVVYIQWSNRAIRDEKGGLKEIISAGTDITQQKVLDDKLRQAQKMEAIGNLAGGIAHDFNNILAGILGYTELAQLEVAENSRTAGFLAQIRSATIRARNLVKQILVVSRKTSEQKKPVHLKRIVSEALELLRSTIPTTINIVAEIEEEPVIVAVEDQIHQVIMNLSTNAFHAMEGSNGTLTIGLRSVTLSSDKEMPTGSELAPGKYAVIEIRDTGHGMESQTLSGIFDPYFTTKSKEKGTGLGLAVVHGIVMGHKGYISVESTPGQGTLFSVYLLVADTISIIETELDVPLVRSVDVEGKVIVFVDDEESIRSLALEFFSRAGYRIELFDKGRDALEWLENSRNRCDCLITDMTMPGMTGYELVRAAREIKPGLPTVLCTGYNEFINSEKAEEWGVDTFIKKPFSFAEFVGTVQELLDDSEERHHNRDNYSAA